MMSWFNKRIILLTIAVVVILSYFIFERLNNNNLGKYVISDGEKAEDTILVNSSNGYTGRFPDIIDTKDGLLAAYYWNNSHAPYNLGDSVGVIKIQRGSADGREWDESKTLIDKEFLIKAGLGVWKGTDCYYYTEEEAEANGAEFCIEARDPNFSHMGEKIVMTFFTRLPYDCNVGEHEYTRYDEKYDYTYGRTYIMVSDDAGETWSNPEEIACNYLDRGCAKRGNIAVITDDTILIPLYGYSSQLGTIYTTSNVMAIYKNGRWKFEKEYCSHIENGTECLGAFKNDVTEVSFAVMDDKIYALLRPTGKILVSETYGKSWEEVETVENGEKMLILHQPSLQTIDKTGQLLASWSEPNEIGGRDIFLMMWSPVKDNIWCYNEKSLIYKDIIPGDMADPTSIMVDDMVLTIYYNAERGVVGIIHTKLEYN